MKLNKICAASAVLALAVALTACGVPCVFLYSLMKVKQLKLILVTVHM